MSRARYLLIHNNHPLSLDGVNLGAEKTTLWLAQALQASGCEVVVCAHLPSGDTQRWGVTFWDLGSNFNIESVLRRARSGSPYHLIAPWSTYSLLTPFDDAHCLSRHVIVHDSSRSLASNTSENLVHKYDSLICFSKAQKGHFIQQGVDPEKIKVFPLGADAKLYRAGDAAKRVYDRFVFVGSFIPQSGIDLLIASFARIAAKNSRAELHVYETADQSGQRSLIDSGEISAKVPNIKFHQDVSDSVIAEAFATAGACIIPSRWLDRSSLTAVEAQMTGCPVITFNLGEIHEVVRHGETGLILNEVSEDSLTKALCEVLTQPEMLKSYSKNALNVARKMFAWDTISTHFREHCEQLEPVVKGDTQPKVGVLTTWNQECGLATYARYMTGAWDSDSYVIFGEKSDALVKSDEPFVTRCWKRDSVDFSELLKATSDQDIDILLLNCQSRFFPQPAFSACIRTLQERGIKVIALIHNLFTIDPQLGSLVRAVDSIIVHSPENRLEAVANGADPDKVHVIPHGVYTRPPVTEQQKAALRAAHNIPAGEKLAVTFGFVQPHKGIDGLLEGVVHLNQQGIPCTGIVAGKANEEDPHAMQYSAALKQVAREAGLEHKVIFLDRFISEEEVALYLGVADIVLLNYRSQHYEASGACSLSVGAGAATVTSLAPPFLPFHDAVMHATAGYPIPLAFEALSRNQTLYTELKSRARKYCEENSWDRVREKLFTIFNWFERKKTRSVEMKKIKVLLHNRPTTFTQRGGDTVVIEKLLAGLAGKDVDITVDLEAKEDPKNYDLVHIFNFAIPDMVQYYGERAQAAGKPFVITTLLEDVPSFHHQSHFVAAMVQQYVEGGQQASQWDAKVLDTSHVQRCAPFKNDWSALNASMLFTNGPAESATLRETYGKTAPIREIKLGYNIGLPGNKERFQKEFGLSDFVFCVGRIESRKNQLMLLKALEHDDITVVFAGGGFSYQPEYAQAVQKFKRKGKTVFLPRLSDQQLADAYAAAKVHALPSWYELPGLVSLEAGYYGCNVVATRRGTTCDYLGEEAFYCDPADPDSIRSAVLAAFYAPTRTGLKEKVMAHSWEETAQRTMDAYKELTGWNTIAATQSTSLDAPKVIDVAIADSDQSGKFEELYEKAEMVAKERQFDEALKLFDQAEIYEPNSPRLARARGAVELARADHQAAKKHFERAIKLDPFDAKSFCGLGMCEVMDNNREQGYKHFVKALEILPDHKVAMLQLIESSYALNTFKDLEVALRRLNAINPGDLEMQFCLAGCLYKQGDLRAAAEINEKILARNSMHTGGRELAKLIDEARAAQPMSTQVEIVRVEQSRSDLSSFAKELSSIDRELIELEDLKRKGRYPEVQEAVEGILRNTYLTSSERETAQCLLGEIFVLTDSVMQAEAIYDSVLSNNMQCARAHCGRGAIAAVRGDWVSAKSYFEEALKIRPEYDVALAGLGLTAAQNKSYEAAWNYYQRALKSNTENIRALLGIIEVGYILRKLTEVEDALKVYLEIHPADLDFMYSLAGCCFAQGKVEEASDAINKITLFNPEHKNALELRSMIERSAQASV